MEFEPLLPDDEQPMPARVRGLADWCNGFMYGLSTAGIATDRLARPEAQEVLADFAEISKADVGDDGDAAEADFAYAEIVEYLRAGAQLLYEEFEIDRAADSQTPH